MKNEVLHIISKDVATEAMPIPKLLMNSLIKY